MSNPTRVMRLKATLKTELAGMTVLAGYNYDYTKIIAAIPHPNDIADDLHLGFYIGKRAFGKLDDPRTVFNKDVNVAIQVVKHIAKKSDEENSEADDAQELIINDLERKISEWFEKYINDATNAWNVSFDKEALSEYPMILNGKDTTKVVVVFEFMIKLRRYVGVSD